MTKKMGTSAFRITCGIRGLASLDAQAPGERVCPLLIKAASAYDSRDRNQLVVGKAGCGGQASRLSGAAHVP
jgi:hypothetical protein